jgi:hypothetical protein
MQEPFINWSYRKVGGIHFLSIGRFVVCFCVKRNAVKANSIPAEGATR